MTATKVAELTGNNDVNSLIAGEQWDSATLTYYFPQAVSAYSDYSQPELTPPLATFKPFGSVEQAAAIRVYDQLSTFTNLTFTEGTSSGPLRMSMSNNGSFARYPNQQEWGGDSWYNSGAQWDQTRAGQINFETIMHEVGHTLGLSHPHENLNKMSTEHDSQEYTVMSYRSYVGDLTAGGYSIEVGGMPQTYMMYDIAVLQHLYGANFTYNASDSVYRWDPLTGRTSINGSVAVDPAINRIFMTVWDGGGNDTYDLSNYSSGVKIDLQPGAWSIASSAQLASLNAFPQADDITTPKYAIGNIANALLFEGDTRSLIENAIGGLGNDTIIGNQADNLLRGGAGDDRLYGNEGNDRVDGGTGADVIYGGAGDDIYVRDNAADAFVERADEGVDLVLASISTTLGANFEKLTLTGGAAINGAGNELANLLTGNDSGNVLFGKSGDDRVVGNGGNDTLDGGSGADIMYGGAGNDTYVRDSAGDVMIEAAGQGTDQVNASVSTQLAGNIERLVLTGASAIDGRGNAEANFIFGNSAANTLDGEGGDDQLIGLGGNDVLQGRAGNDTLQGGEGVDAVFGGAGTDILFGGGGADSFRFGNGDFGEPGSPDQIRDFSHAQGDRINLAAVDADTTLGADQAFHFIGTAAFDGSAGALRYEQVDGNTFVYADTNGDMSADLMIRLDGVKMLVVGDFGL